MFRAVGPEGARGNDAIERHNAAIAEELGKRGANALHALRKSLNDKTTIRYIDGRPPDTIGSKCTFLIAYHHSDAFLSRVKPKLKEMKSESLIGLLATPYESTAVVSASNPSTQPSIDWVSLMLEYKASDECGADYYIIRDGNNVIRGELLRRGKTALPALEKHQKESRRVFTGSSGPMMTVGILCDELITEINESSNKKVKESTSQRISEVNH